MIKQIVSAGDAVGTVEIAGGQTGTVEILAAEDFEYPLAPGETAAVKLGGAGFVYAPAVCGSDAGIAHICIDGITVGKIRLIYGETVEQIPVEEKSFWKRLLEGE